MVSKITNLWFSNYQENGIFMNTLKSNDPKIEESGIPQINSAHSLFDEPILVPCLHTNWFF